MTPTQKSRKTPTQKSRNFSYFKETMEKLNISSAELSSACGYAKTAHCRWQNEGKMPAVAGLACECLLRRQSKEASLPASRDICVMLVPQKEAERFAAVCQAFDVTVIISVPPPIG